MATKLPAGENTPATDNNDLLGEKPTTAPETPIVPVVSVVPVESDVTVALAMQKRILELEAALEASKTSEQKAIESAAHNAAAAQSALLFTTSITEVMAGEDDAGNPLWKYKIDLPPSGGTDIRVNMTPYYHGETYTFSTDLLRTIKEMVQRAWGHEASIQGSNENFYRREMNQKISGRGR